ncbi:MAG TPA: CAP domain-containing protein [Solirubrobacteraceae bacterium]|nr:CAP domain-containing protein [Solirubrobacteraceae bacterium]
MAAALLGCAGPLAVSAAPATASACPGASLRPNGADAPAVTTATLCLINRIRAAHHVRPLRSNRALGHVAAGQLSSMVRRNYFADVRPSGQTPMSLVRASSYRAHTAGLSVGENLAWGTGSYATPAHIVAEWMASPPHRQIMLSGEYRDAGVAVTAAVPSILSPSRHGATYAIEFGVRWF